MTRPAEHFPFIAQAPELGLASLAPMLPLTLAASNRVSASGLLDTGASTNVLPYSVGVALGLDWNLASISIQLSGNLAVVEARAVAVQAFVGGFPPVRLAFAWARSDAMPLLLGQMNFFLEFDVCFFRSRHTFELRPALKSR